MVPHNNLPINEFPIGSKRNIVTEFLATKHNKNTQYEYGKNLKTFSIG